MRRILKEAVTYDDVLLVPQYSNIQSRSEVDVGNFLSEHVFFPLPIISSPMDTVTEEDMAIAMHNNGGLGIIHRYNSIEEQAGLVLHTWMEIGKAPVAAAIGMTGDFLERTDAVVANGARIICVDVAHGHHGLMRKALTVLKNKYGDTIHVIAGNIATLDGFNDLADWGADSIRCNIGGGSICSTRVQTGHGMPGLQTVLDCSRSNRKVNIIADGGIRNSGDAVKALAAGADFVMLGSLLAGTDESPGEVQSCGSRRYKIYRGMASKDAQLEWKGTTSSDEGISTTVNYKGPVGEILQGLRKGIASGFSYSGCRSISELQSKSLFTIQTNAGLFESGTHILAIK